MSERAPGSQKKKQQRRRRRRTSERRKRRRQADNMNALEPKAEARKVDSPRIGPQILATLLLLFALILINAGQASSASSTSKVKGTEKGATSQANGKLERQSDDSLRGASSGSESPPAQLLVRTASSFESFAPDEDTDSGGDRAATLTPPTKLDADSNSDTNSESERTTVSSSFVPTTSADLSNLDEATYESLDADMSPTESSVSSSTVSTPGERKSGAASKASSSVELANLTNAQLVRNRKSPDCNCTSPNERKAPSSPTSRRASLATTVELSGEANSTQPSQASAPTSTEASALALAPTFSAGDYDDFDLDYQLNLSSIAFAPDSAATGASSLGKREHEHTKPPAWSALIGQPHVFGVATNSSVAGHFNTAPPMPPSLLTVHSNQLTSQQLGVLRPQLLLYQENYDSAGQSAASELSQSPANGDLIATASGGAADNVGPPTRPVFNLGVANLRAKLPDSMISLLNGSPLVRQPAQEPAQTVLPLLLRPTQSASKKGSSNRTLDSRTGADSTLQPTDTPPLQRPAATAAPATSGSSAASVAPSKGPSQANQWLNYPDPAVHHNPLLLHHILNKPALYAQHLGASQQQQVVAASTTPSTTQWPSGRSSPEPQIVERPTLAAADLASQAAPLNRTQLQMQLEEIKAIAGHQAKQTSSSRPSGNTDSSGQQTHLFADRARAQVVQPGDNSSSKITDQHERLMSSGHQQSGNSLHQTSILETSMPIDLVGAPRGNQPAQSLADNTAKQSLAAQTIGGLLRHSHSQQLEQQQQIKSALGSQLIAAPSLLKEFYASQPNSVAPLATLLGAQVQQSQASAPNAIQGFIRQLAANQSLVRTSQASANSGSASQQANSISDEDMSTYVSQLASFGGVQMSGQQPAEQLAPWTAWTGQQMSNSSAIVGDSRAPSEKPASANLRAVSLLQHLGLPSGNVAKQASELDVLVRRLVEAQTQTQRASQQLPGNLIEFLEQVKLIGLPADVQSQLYREHIAPTLRLSGPPYSSFAPPTMESSNQLSSYALPAVESAQAYASLDGHQRQQKKGREQQEQQLERQEKEQQLKQLAFIEALRLSAMRMQAAGLLSSPNDGVALKPNQSQSSSEPKAFGDELDEQASAKPSEWPERQLQQESLVHELAHVHPLGQSTRTTFIGRNSQPLFSSLTSGAPTILRQPYQQPGQLYQLPGPPRGMLRPLASIAQPSLAGLERPLYPLPLLPPGGGALASPASFLANRLPLNSAPAYLVRLPSLAGGSVGAAGALLPPPRLLSSRPASPLQLLGTAGSIVPTRIRLAPSPAPWRAPHLFQPATLRPLFAAPSPSAHWLADLPGQQWARPSVLATSHSYQPAEVGALDLASSAGQPLASLLSYWDGSQASQPGADSTASLQATPSSQASGPKESSAQAATSSHLADVQQARPVQVADYSQMFAAQPGQVFATPASGQSSAAAAALSRLQQATASLVELTSLASLVEEMMSGPDVESPATVLAKAISQLSAAQSAALSAQASATTNGQATIGADSTQSGHLQAPASASQAAPFSWKTLLNASLWRDKSLANKLKEFSALERLVGSGARKPVTRLRVKYIRVPVAVYENANANLETTGLESPPRKQLVTKTQLAEIVAQGNSQAPAQGSGSSSDGSLASSANTSSSSGPTSGLAVSSAHSSSNSATSSASGASASSAQSGGGATPSSVAAAASANELLFDEVSADSAPQLALALRDLAQQQQQQQDEQLGQLRVEYLPLIASVSGPPTRKLVGAGQVSLSPVESARYYSLLAAPSVASVAPRVPTAEQQQTKEPERRPQQEESEEDEREEEEEDDDILSGADLPLLESIISTLVQGPPASAYNPYQLYSPQSQQQAYSLFGWRHRPFGGFRTEPTSSYETYAHPAMQQPSAFGKHAHRFSLGELVGALGARKLLLSLLSRRKGSRTSKRATGAQQAAAWPPPLTPLQLAATKPTNVRGATGPASRRPAQSMKQAMTVKYPPIAAYESSGAKAAPKKTNSKRRPAASSSSSSSKPVISAEKTRTSSSVASSTTSLASTTKEQMHSVAHAKRRSAQQTDELQFKLIVGVGRGRPSPTRPAGNARGQRTVMPAYQLLPATSAPL